jgi:AraC family transcriptional regulator, transcriptional activator of pobA
MNKIPLYKYFDEADFSTPLSVNEISEQSKYDDYTAHRHGYYELFFFQNGGGTHSIDFKELEITDCSIHAVSPGQVHRLMHTSTCKGKYIVFSTEMVKSIMGAGDLQTFAFLNNNTVPIALHLNKNLFTEILGMIEKIESNSKKPALSLSWLQLVLNYINEEFHGKNTEQAVYIKNSTYQKFKQLLENSFQIHHGVRWYAAELSLTEKKLNTLTQQIMGESPSELIQQRILLEAKRLIIHSNTSFKEITFDLGFSEPGYFSRFIKNQTGYSPKELRNSQKHK